MFKKVTLPASVIEQFILPGIVVLACAIGVGALQLPRLHQISHSEKTDSLAIKKETSAQKLSLELMQQMPTFGFDNLTADWAFLNFLQYFGDDGARQKTDYSLSPDYFKVIIARDPRFLAAYPFLSTSISMYALMPDQAVALMAAGLKAVSPTIPQRSYYIWRYKGIDELLFLGDAQAAKHSFEMATKWTSYYSDPESKRVGILSQKTAQFLAHNPKSKSAQVAAWAMVLSNQVDQRTRNKAIRHIQALGAKIVINPQGIAQIELPKE